MKLITHLLVPILRISGSILLFPSICFHGVHRDKRSAQCQSTALLVLLRYEIYDRERH